MVPPSANKMSSERKNFPIRGQRYDCVICVSWVSEISGGEGAGKVRGATLGTFEMSRELKRRVRTVMSTPSRMYESYCVLTRFQKNIFKYLSFKVYFVFLDQNQFL